MMQPLIHSLTFLCLVDFSFWTLFLRYALRLHSFQNRWLLTCFYGAFNLILFFVCLISLLMFIGCRHEGQGTLNTRGKARSCLCHSYENAVLWLFLLALLIFVWVLVFRPLFLLLLLFKLFFRHLTSSIFQRKAMHFCLVLLHLINTLLRLLRHFLIIEVLYHRLVRRIDYILCYFEFILKVFCLFWRWRHELLYGLNMLTDYLLDHVL